MCVCAYVCGKGCCVVVIVGGIVLETCLGSIIQDTSTCTAHRFAAIDYDAYRPFRRLDMSHTGMCYRDGELCDA